MSMFHVCYDHLIEMLGALLAAILMFLRALGIKKELSNIQTKLDKILDEVRNTKRKR
jgi:hypothetical protein